MNWNQSIGRLLGLENVRSIDGIEPSLAAPWAHNYPALVVFGCGLLAALSIAFYLNYQTGTRRKTRIVLAICREAVLSLLLLILADPVLTVRLTNNPRPLLWVLFDGTDSMNIVDEMPEADRARLASATGASSQADQPSAEKADRLSRIEYVRAWVSKQKDNDLARLSEKFRLRAFVLDRADGVRGLDWDSTTGERVDPEVVNRELKATAQVTALGKAFDDLALRHATSNLAGLVVVSDFDQNSGPPPLAKAKVLGKPVYTVGVGPASAIDLAVDLQAPAKMKKAEQSIIPVTVRQTGLDGDTVTVNVTAHSLIDSGAPAVEIVVGSRSVPLSGPSVVVDFPFTPEDAGRFEFVAEVTPLAGEVVDQNNRSSREVNILDDFMRLMFVEYEPTWEWRFIKEVFHRDKMVGTRGFRTFLRSSDPKVRISNELFLPTLTPQRSEFFANDVIFLGDMPGANLSPRFCEMVKEFVGTFGGGLVIISGPRFGPAQLAGTELADMLPVVVDPDARVQDQKEFHLQLTSDAQLTDFMQLNSDAAENRKAWDNLGPLSWYQPVARKHPLATVLAQHPTDKCADGVEPQPLIAMRQYGARGGQVVYLGFNETWRLRRKYGELFYRQFWGQMIHRLSLSHALGNQKRFVVRTDRQQYRADDEVILTAEAYDANFEPLSDEKLADRKLLGELIAPERPGETMASTPILIPEAREGVFETRIKVANGGNYRLRVKDPVTEEYQELNFRVASVSAERLHAVRNVALQEQIARETGGKSYDLANVSRLADEIKLETITDRSVKVFPLWDTWLVFGLIVALMLGEWLGRKLINLP